MYQALSTNSRAVAVAAKAFAKKLGHGYVGREHLLYAFSSGAGGVPVKIALEGCGMSESAVRSAIDVIDGGKHSHARLRRHTVDETLAEDSTGVSVPVSDKSIEWHDGLTPNAETVLRMADRESDGNPSCVDILKVLLREAGRSDDNRRIMRVIEHVTSKAEVDKAVSQLIG